MRITTQMLDRTIKKAGLPTRRASMWNYIGGTEQQSGSVENLSSTVRQLKNKSYQKTEKISGELLTNLTKLNSDGKDSIWEKADTTKDRKELTGTVEKAIDSYNELLKNLQGAGGNLNLLYAHGLSGAATDFKEELQAVGITQSKDGKLSINKEVFEKADLENVKKLFGKDARFGRALTFYAEKAGDYAKARVQSTGSQYTSGGNEQYIEHHNYDFWS